jgi:hypothetical protein
MSPRTIIRVVAFVAAAISSADASAQEPFQWTGRITAGKKLEIKGISGDVRAVAAPGDEARVVARKSADDSDPARVRIEVVEHADGVTLCAVYPAPQGRAANTCAPGKGGRAEIERNNDVKVDFEVQVPRGVQFAGTSVNGSVAATGLSGDVEAYSVNGDVDVSTTGLARAHTVNGTVDVAFGRTDWTGDLKFESVNGSVTVTLTGTVNADVNASTVNGGISSDYPLTVQGRFGPRSIRGTIGSGGRSLTLSSVNGSIAIKRR